MRPIYQTPGECSGKSVSREPSSQIRNGQTHPTAQMFQCLCKWRTGVFDIVRIRPSSRTWVCKNDICDKKALVSTLFDSILRQERKCFFRYYFIEKHHLEILIGKSFEESCHCPWSLVNSCIEFGSIHLGASPWDRIPALAGKPGQVSSLLCPSVSSPVKQTT